MIYCSILKSKLVCNLIWQLAIEIFMLIFIIQFLFISEFVQLNEADEAWLFRSSLQFQMVKA